MDKQEHLTLIKALSQANGVSGFEDEVAELLREFCGGTGEYRQDAMRNTYFSRNENRGNRPVLQLDAHMDEVGFMVHSVRTDGTLQFIPLGGWTPYTIPAHMVRVQTRDGRYIPGVIASKPPHFTSDAERKNTPGMEQMSIDIGATSQKEAIESFGVEIGRPVVPEAAFEYITEHDIMFGKAFDCRLGCAALAATLKKLQGKSLSVDITAAFSTQEEVGTRGAAVTTSVVRPSAAIVFEGTPADDVAPGAYPAQTFLKKGPMLRYIDAKMITNPRFQRFALEVGRTLSIPVQAAVRTGGATNGGAIHLANQGVPVIVIGIPVRYIHTHHGLAAYQDYAAAVDLACAIIERMDEEQIRNF